MSFDSHANFGYGTVTNNAGTAGTTVVIGTANFAQFPDPSTNAYNVTIWSAGAIPEVANSEIARVTAKGTDGTLTVTRAQESTSNRDIVIGDQLALSITSKTVTDIEGLFPNSTVVGETDTQTLTNKTLTNPMLGGTVSVSGKITQSGTADHITITPGTNKLVKTAILRRDGTVDSYNNDSVILTGRSPITITSGSRFGTTAVTFGITFSTSPIINVSMSGDSTTYASEDENPFIYVNGTPSTTGFTVKAVTNSTTVAADRVTQFDWIAMGQLT